MRTKASERDYRSDSYFKGFRFSQLIAKFSNMVKLSIEFVKADQYTDKQQVIMLISVGAISQIYLYAWLYLSTYGWPL